MTMNIMKLKLRENFFSLNSNFLTVICLFIIFAIGLYFRILFLQLFYWVDETNTIYYISRDFWQMIEYIKHDFSPPFYYILLHFWIKIFGESNIITGLLSLIFNLLSLPIVYILGKKIYDKQVGIFAAVIFWLSPLIIFQSTETRMYSLVILLSLLSCLFFWLNIKKEKLYFLVPYIFFSILGLYSHNAYIFLFISQLIFWFGYILLSFEKSYLIFSRWFISYFTIGIFYLYWIPIYIKQILNSSSAPYYWTVFQSEDSFFGIFNLLFDGLAATGDGSIIRILFLAIFSYLIIIALKFSLFVKDKTFFQYLASYFLIFLFIFPCILATLAGVLIPKYLIYVYPLFFIFVAFGIKQTGFAKKPVIIYLIIICFSSFLIGVIDDLKMYSKFRAPEIADLFYKQNSKEESQLILVNNFISKVNFDYYYKGGIKTISAFPKSLIIDNDRELSEIRNIGLPYINEDNSLEIIDQVKDFKKIWYLAYPDEIIYDYNFLVEEILLKSCSLINKEILPKDIVSFEVVKIYEFTDCNFIDI